MASPSVLALLLAACAPDQIASPDSCTTPFFLDGDSDGHGDPTVWVTACEAPSAYAASSDDCDDTNAIVQPGAAEICDGVDDDCDGTVDAAAVDATVWFADRDDDGYGDDAATATRCDRPAGHVDAGGDCDDHDASVSPAGVEICDGIDDDCDGLVDSVDTTLVDGETWYVDADGDHFGDPTNSVEACEHPVGTVDDDHDCDDADGAVHPEAHEACDGIDNDCDGLADDAEIGPVLGVTRYFVDSDGDGVGVGTAWQEACVAPKGWALEFGDCDDTDATVLIIAGWYDDHDGDGYGEDPLASAGYCNPPYSFSVQLGGDCNDEDDAVYPTAPEICDDERDNNCDATIDGDDPLVVLATWYGDWDGDDFGADADTALSCRQPDHYVERGGDCDDGDVYVNPDAPEYCDAQDNDCDGRTDESIVYIDWYADADGDGYGIAEDSQNDCVAPSGYTPLPGDCDDTLASTSPGELEACGNGADDDCDGVEDNCRIASDEPDFLTEGFELYGDAGQTMGAPDLDADGTADLVLAVAASSDDLSGGWILYGPVSGVTLLEDEAIVLRTGVEGTELGSSLAAGDTDGDGLDDAVLGSAESSDGAYVFLGPITADRMAADIVFRNGGDLLGYALDLAPDVDGDGAPDLVIGAPGADCSTSRIDCGVVYVATAAPGADLDLSTDATYEYFATGTQDRLGEAASHAGDTNGDGIAELALCAPLADPLGAVYVIEGGATAGTYDASSSASATLELSEGSTPLDDVVLVATDYDDDGRDDLVVGAPKVTATQKGEVYLFFGPLSGAIDEGDADVTWSHSADSALLGCSIDIADVDSDGQQDVLMGARDFDGEVGAAYLQLGKAGGSVDVEDLATFPAAEEDVDGEFGGGVVFIPDWTGDGRPEVAIGAPRWGDGGKVYGYLSETIF